MEVPSARLNPGHHFPVVDESETPVSRWNKCSEVARLIFPFIACSMTVITAVVTIIESTLGEDQELIKQSACIAAGNLLSAALIERISKCFGNKNIMGLTAATLKGSCFPLLVLAGSFDIKEIMGPLG